MTLRLLGIKAPRERHLSTRRDLTFSVVRELNGDDNRISVLIICEPKAPRETRRASPAMAAGIENRLWSMEDGASLLSGANIIFAPVR
jgi:hypothetical protein